VEDEPAVRAYVQEILSSNGYSVSEAQTAEETIFLSNGYGHPIQLLMTDIVLPQRRGTALAEELLDKRPAIKVLLMAGYIDRGRRNDTALTRRMPFIQKPFTKEVLLAKVREVLDF